MITDTQLRTLAPVLLRLSLTAVVAWFGISQLMNPGAWMPIVPSWATAFGMSATAIIYLNGTFEVITGILLGIGLFIRWVALLLSLHLFVIASSFGISAIGVRDFGLACGFLSTSLFGNDTYSFHPSVI